jgi:prepilin-type N-terminal cleavage/methylation domain-containing protein
MNRKHLRGFTLIEIMVVVLIIAILAALLLPALMKSADTRKKLLAHENVRAIKAAAILYYEEIGVFPPDTNDFDTGDIKDTWIERESIYRYLGRKVEDKATGKFYGPYMNINNQYLKDEIFYDPWGKPYEMDALHVNVVKEKGPKQGDVERMGSPYPAGTPQDKQIIEVKVWSPGPDGKTKNAQNVEFGKGDDLLDQDNITSWAD